MKFTHPTAVLLTGLLTSGMLLGCRDAPYEALRSPSTGPSPSQPAFQVPTGGMPAPPPPSGPFLYPVPAANTGWNSSNPNVINGATVGPTFAQESATLRLEVRQNYGGSIQLFDKVTGQYLINFHDKGRESGYSSYSGPADFAKDTPFWKSIGYNPLQAGDDGKNPSPVLAQGIVDGWLYTKTQCLSWPHRTALRLPFYYEQWARLDDNKVYVRVRLTHERPDTTFYGPNEQEWPFLYLNGALILRFYNGDAPFTYAPTTVTNSIERRTLTGGYVMHQGTPFGVTEPWQAAEIGQSGGSSRLIGIYSEDMYRTTNTVLVIEAQENYEGSSTSTYVSGRPFVNLDARQVWNRSYDLIVGSEQQIRDHVYARSQLVRAAKPDFLFSRPSGRCGWYALNGAHDQNEPFGQDHWRVTFDGQRDPVNSPTNARNTKLLSPCGSWPAALTGGTVYLRMAYRGPESRLKLTWLLSGQAADGMDSNYPNQNALRFPNGTRPNADNSQALEFDVIGDGQLHTYQLPVGGKASWRGIIQQFELKHTEGTAVIAPGEQFELVYFGATDPGD